MKAEITRNVRLLESPGGKEEFLSMGTVRVGLACVGDEDMAGKSGSQWGPARMHGHAFPTLSLAHTLRYEHAVGGTQTDVHTQGRGGRGTTRRQPCRSKSRHGKFPT